MKEGRLPDGSRIVTVSPNIGLVKGIETLTLAPDGTLFYGRAHDGTFPEWYRLEKDDAEDGRRLLQGARARIARELTILHQELQVCQSIEDSLSKLQSTD